LTYSLLDRASGLLDLASGICETGEQIADFDDLAGTDHNRTNRRASRRCPRTRSLMF
jgi:hypothetical protein